MSQEIIKCIDCGKEISRKAKRCRSCEGKRKHKSGILCYPKSKPLCVDCGKQLIDHRSKRCRHCATKFIMQDEKMRKYLSIVNKGKHRSPKTEYKKGHIALKGINNPNYINGQGNAPYPLEFSDNLKEKIRKRDNHTCQVCGIKEQDYKRKLDVHHIDYDKENCKEENLITLCNECNCKANYKRSKWKQIFQEKINDIYQLCN